MELTSAQLAYSRLNGIICVYKPPLASIQYVATKIKVNLCRDLNSLETRPQNNYVEVNRTQDEVSINVRPSYADHLLCVGPRYTPEDISISFPSHLSNFMAGVLVVGINAGYKLSGMLKAMNLTKAFHVKGILGQASEDFLSSSRIIARAKYNKVNKYHIDKILSSYQSFTQRKMFEQYGVNMKSEKAYELAVSGLQRPQEKGASVFYSLKCFDFNPPNFTIEVQCLNETEDYLKELIHNLGVSSKAFATCSGMRCIRQGCFHLEHALLTRQWTLDNILKNMEMCYEVLEEKIPRDNEKLSVVGTSPKVKRDPEDVRDPYSDQVIQLGED